MVSFIFLTKSFWSLISPDLCNATAYQSTNHEDEAVLLRCAELWHLPAFIFENNEETSVCRRFLLLLHTKPIQFSTSKRQRNLFLAQSLTLVQQTNWICSKGLLQKCVRFWRSVTGDWTWRNFNTSGPHHNNDNKLYVIFKIKLLMQCEN
jgi:hypothetical protein